MKIHIGLLLLAVLYCLSAVYLPAQGQTPSTIDQQQTDAITRFVDLLLNCVLKLSEQDQIDMMNSANNLAAKAEQLKELCAKIQENPFRFLDLVFALAENNQLIVSEAFKIIDFRQFDKWVQLVVDILLRRLDYWTNQTTQPPMPSIQTQTFNWNVTWATSPSNMTWPPYTPFPNGSWPTWWPSNVTAPPVTWPTNWPTPYPNGSWPTSNPNGSWPWPTGQTWWPSNSTMPPITWPPAPSNSTMPPWWPTNATGQPFTWPTLPSNYTFTPYPNGSWPTVPTWWPQNSSVTAPPITWPTFPANFTWTPYPNGTWPNYTMPTWWPTAWPQNSTAPPITWPTFPANFTWTPYPNGTWPNYTMPTQWPTGWPNNNGSTNPPITWPPFVTSNSSTLAPPKDGLLKDPSYCSKYTIADCAITPSGSQPINPAPYICVGLCTCSPKLKCFNNGIVAYNDKLQCQCICEAGFTGTSCEISSTLQREMCLPSLLEQGGCLKESIRIACPSLCAGFSG